MEQIQPGKMTNAEGIEKFKQSFVMSELMGYRFPNDNIKNNYHDAIIDFIYWYKPLKVDKNIIEEEFLINIEDKKLRGFIDLYVKQGDDILVLDWKSSSWSGFSGAEKLQEKGRQLALYAHAIEEKTGIMPKKAAWVMMKYVNIKHGKRRSKRIERQKFVQTFMSDLLDDMGKLGYTGAEISLLLNGKRTMKDVYEVDPRILENFSHTIAVLEYPLTKEIIDEAKQYVYDTASMIEGMSGEEKDYPPVTLNKSTTFFCQHLCNHGHTCKYYKSYLKANDPNKSQQEIFNMFNK